MDLYKTIAWELGLPTERNRAALYKRIREEVTRLTVDAKIRTVLILDEAQNLRNDVLEELRLLTNYAMDSENRLCLLLSGQTELRRRLGMAVHEALNQRIIVRYHLPGLKRDELPEYLSHLTKRAGCELPLFEPAAIEAIFQATKGSRGKSAPSPTTPSSPRRSTKPRPPPRNTSNAPSRRCPDAQGNHATLRPRGHGHTSLGPDLRR